MAMTPTEAFAKRKSSKSRNKTKTTAVRRPAVKKTGSLTPHGPTETAPFVTDLDAFTTTDGLSGSNIALWQSHGRYFEPKLNRWEWQRARVLQTVEDLYTQAYVMPLLTPMLNNAGAYVLSPRERDTNLTEIIVDDDSRATPGYKETNGRNRWQFTSKPGFGWDGNELTDRQHPFSDGKSRMAATVDANGDASYAIWKADIPTDGNYAVYVSYATLDNSAPDALYTVHTAAGDRHFRVNQKMGGGTWVYLGHFPLTKGSDKPVVTLSNVSEFPGTAVSADAVKIGGGMGLVSRKVNDSSTDIPYKATTSGYPKFTEGARYFLQWAGAPDSVFSPTDYVDDYVDDYRSRALWVNWLTGGSSMLPDSLGLNIPIDLSLAFHSDAGTFSTDSVVGTLGIYCTIGDTLGNGDSREISGKLTDMVMTSITNDIRALHEPRWTRRDMRNRSYFEARAPMVPAMLLELLSHQNFYDMQHGLDPAFRFTVSRAIYKAILRFIAMRDGRKYVVQPLPVHNFAIVPFTQSVSAQRKYRLSWEATPDSLEPTASPTYYIVEHRKGSRGDAFCRLDTVHSTSYIVDIDDSDIHSFRIVAANSGGLSFPSETLALADLHNGKEPVLVVNGFTRISGPDIIDLGPDYAGFDDKRDHGVPYIEDISYIGSQYEFRRNLPWLDDDNAGFGSSRSTYEKDVIPGNTFNFTAIHGEAIVAAGHSFYSTSVGAYAISDASLEPRIVDIILGKQKETKTADGAYGTHFKALPRQLQTKIESAALNNKTSFFLSGAYIGSDIWENPYTDAQSVEDDKRFASEILGFTWRAGQATERGDVYEVANPFKAFNGGKFAFATQLNREIYAAESPDAIIPSDFGKGFTIMRYDENNLPAATATDFGAYRTVVAGFPFETIFSSEQRNRLMKQIIHFLDKQ